jgi:hypothetical protein
LLQIETIENLEGFGDKNFLGEYYHSENLVSGQFGLEANASIIADSVTDSPTRFNWIAEISVGIHAGLYAVDTTGKIFFRTGTTWSLVHTPSKASNGNGLFSIGNQIYYAEDEFIGTYNSSYVDDSYDFDQVKTALKPIDQYEDWLIFGHDRKLAVNNLVDDSFDESSMTLPPNFEVRAIKSNQTGVLIGSNFNNQGVLFLWDVRSVRSISEWIWLKHPIQSICKYGTRWIVTTSKEQLITDGYSTTPLPSLPDIAKQTAGWQVHPAGTLVVGNKLYTANTATGLNRLKPGLYIQDLDTGLFQFVPVANGCRYGVTMGAMFIDSNLNHFVSYSTTLPSAHFIGRVVESSPSIATLVSPRLGAGPSNKIAKGLKLDVSANPKTTALNSSGSFDVSAKIYNFKRQLWGYAVTNGASASAITLKVDGSLLGYNNAKVGDEVTILSGANAGQIRHIASIANAGTNTETWTLDSALSGNTESGAYVNVQPFQLIKTKSISFSNLDELESIYFDIRNHIKGRKFLAKLVISNINGVALAMPSLTFIYDDQGVI